MDNNILNLFNYANHQGVIENLDKNIDELFKDNIDNITFDIDNKRYTYDFTKNDISNKRILDEVRQRLPLAVIVDLIYEAINLGIVEDVSEDYKTNSFISYDFNYQEISQVDCFYFKINSESFDDTLYKITFDKKRHDIKNKIEYASRTSLFIDTLIKRIMSKYNMLLVKKASFSSEKIPSLRLNNLFMQEYIESKDSNIETDKIENQLKVLINYRDNFNNTTCTENVIDDIFINISGTNINYGFYDIMQSSNDDIDINYELINEDVSSFDIDSLLQIRNLIYRADVKFNIFETLRQNNNSNLYKLLNERIKDYDKELNQDPKIEFSITPLSIYCNHIVEKTCTFRIKSINPLYSNYSIDYSISYNPQNISNTVFPIYGDGDIESLKEDDELILAFSDIPSDAKEPDIKVTSKDYATMLYKFTKRYDNEIYKDVYFLNEALVKIVDNNLVAYDGILDNNTYLKSQVVRGEISGKYIPIDEAYKIDKKDILGLDLIDEVKDRYIAKEYLCECDICHHHFGATKDVWQMYKENHKVVNDGDGKSCCEYCQGTILPSGNAIIYSKGYNEYYYDNPIDLKHTELCINCDKDQNAFIYVNSMNRQRRCKICRKYYCKDHINLDRGICINCSGDINSFVIPENKKVLSKIKMSLDPADMLAKDLKYNYIKDASSLWVYRSKKDLFKTYYFLVSEDESSVYLMAKKTRRGGK